MPAHEFPTDKNAIELFRSQWREQFEVRRDAEHIYQQVSKSAWPAGIEYWQPLFFSQPLPSLFSYLPANTLIVNTGDLEGAAERFWQDVNQRYESRRVDPMRPLLAPDTLWLRVDALFGELKAWPRIALKTDKLPPRPAIPTWTTMPCPIWRCKRSVNPRWITCGAFIEGFDGSVIFSVERGAA